MYSLNLTNGKVLVLAPKLRNFYAIGFFLARFESSELENVTIKFWDNDYITPWRTLKEYQVMFKVMLSQLSRAKIPALDMWILQISLYLIFYIYKEFSDNYITRGLFKLSFSLSLEVKS